MDRSTGRLSAVSRTGRSKAIGWKTNRLRHDESRPMTAVTDCELELPTQIGPSGFQNDMSKAAARFIVRASAPPSGVINRLKAFRQPKDSTEGLVQACSRWY